MRARVVESRVDASGEQAVDGPQDDASSASGYVIMVRACVRACVFARICVS